MPIRSEKFKLEYFKGGSYWSAASEYRRFWTLDYNLNSYVGVVGVGIINGWTVEKVDGLTVQILPGTGIINGYSAESPYTVKQRSDMVSGDREISIINESDIPESNLEDTDTVNAHHHFISDLDSFGDGNLGLSIGTGVSHSHSIVSGIVTVNLSHTHTLPSERWNYIEVIKLYDTSYDPSGEIENAYVKTVIPTQLTMYNNADTYIYAEFPSGQLPYPTSLPTPPGPAPIRKDYSDYNSYKIDLDLWDASVAAVNNYKWYLDAVNHFTAVDFTISGKMIKSSTKVLLARVTSRAGLVKTIDTTGIDNLQNMQSTISKFAKEYIVGHKHGGNKFYDPPKIRLETDIRDAVLSKYSNNNATFSVVENGYTGISLGHKHTYAIDDNGNGITIDRIGQTSSHYHTILNNILSEVLGNTSLVEPHTHTLNIQLSGMWNSDSNFIVYVNDIIYGDETSTNISVDSINKTITFYGGINVAYSNYKCSFPVSFVNNGYGSLDEIYTYESKSYSVYYFMLSMINDYNKKYAIYTTIETTTYSATGAQESVASDTAVANLAAAVENISRSPFEFNGAGFSDLKNQCDAAQALLKNNGDTFIFTPNAAKNITIGLVSNNNKIDSVYIEILSNTEVTGTLKPENIFYLNANKILTGEFIPEVIPFISHAGRMKEPCLPFQYSLVSNDGCRYQVVPLVTEPSLDHYHKLYVDTSINGITTDVMIGNDVVYYVANSNSVDNTYFIYHSHSVVDAAIVSSNSDGLLQWMQSQDANATSSSHTHEITYPVVGDNKAIYSIKEDIYGNLYTGTSDGLMIIPSTPAYEFVINGVELYFYGNDLWDVFGKAKQQYEKETGNPLVITEELYGSKIDEASTTLVNDGDSVFISGISYPDKPTDEIMIKRISNFEMPQFGFTREVREYTLKSGETLISQRVITEDGVDVLYSTVYKDFSRTPIWSMEIETSVVLGENYINPYTSTGIIAVGSNVITSSSELEKTPYQMWLSYDVPFFIGISRKVIKDYQGAYWFATNNSIAIHRPYYGTNTLTMSNLPAGNPNVMDIVEGEIGSIYSVSESGAFRTTDGGKSWSLIYDVIGGFVQILRDKTQDRTDEVNGHYHKYEVNVDGDGFLSESIGSGVAHVHEVIEWNVSPTLDHSHYLIVTLYLVDTAKIIWRSLDNGITWSKFTDLPNNECGDCFAAFGYIFVSKSDGLYRSIGGEWQIVLSKRIYSYEWNRDTTAFFVGGDSVIYKTYNGSSFELIYTFDGYPLTSIIQNGNSKNFGYAYNNSSQTFHFKNFTMTSEEMTALIDVDKWYASTGGWEFNDPYDVYINYKKIFSTKNDFNKMSEYGYYFNVNTQEGIIDFSAITNLTRAIYVFDDTIDVASSYGFNVGDRVVVYSEFDRFYFNITAINGNNFTMDSRSTKSMPLSSIVEKITSLNSDSNIIVNVYNSLMSNIGTYTHDNLEDILSYYSDGRPFKLNDTYLSNLLQLTQAIRYVYPTINSEFINSLFYDFRYSLDPNSPYYINKYIDVLTSDIYNQKFFDSLFDTKWAKSINKILIGYGIFDGTIIVATEIGLFWSRKETSVEANWFYVNELPFTVYDLAIFNGYLMAATKDGIYTTSDMSIWEKSTATSIDYPAYCISSRFLDRNTATETPAHDVDFINLLSGTSTYGEILSSSGTPYSEFAINNWIKVFNADDKNGSYSIVSIGDAGAGYGSKLTVTPAFEGINETKSGVVIVMGTWWNQWSGETNISDPLITNTFLIGGANHISYNNGGISDAWKESAYPIEVGDFVANDILSLDNGGAVLCANGTNISNLENYLMRSRDLGETFEVYETFKEIKGTIISHSISEFNNTILSVLYTFPINFVYSDGILDQLNITVFENNSNFALFSGKVIWNEVSNGDKIFVFGNDLNSLIRNDINYRFVVSPSKINAMSEDSNGNIFYGTDRGMYYDYGTATSTYYPSGSVVTDGYNGSVSSIDINGTIISIAINASESTSMITVTSDTNLRANDLIGGNLYITDLVQSSVVPISIIGNNSVSTNGQSSISINVILPSNYVGKRFRISGQPSRIYVNFGLPVVDNQFDGGTLYIADNLYGNLNTSYMIKKSTTEYIDLYQSLVPISNFILPSSIRPTDLKVDLQIGQSVVMVSSDGLFTVFVTLDREFLENSLSGLSLRVTNTTYDHIIQSNFKNSITLRASPSVLSVNKGDTFEIRGVLFEQLPSFSHNKTSIESSHYHSVDMVDGIVSGEIESFGLVNSSYVVINVINTENFDNDLVKYREDLFEGAEIIFTYTNSPNLVYRSEVVSSNVYSSSITVRIKQTGFWDFGSFSPSAVSVGWKWEIDGTNYGYTDGITYDDFNVLSYGIKQTASLGDTDIKIENTGSLIVGDKVRLQDDTISYEYNYVKQIIDSTTIKLRNPLTRTFFYSKNPQIKVLRDTFENTHLHQIRDNEVEPISISDYLINGYPEQHSHRVIPLISEVSTLLKENNNVICGGSGSIIYKTSDNGSSWSQVVDLNDYLEGSEEINGSSAMTLNSGNLIVGATNGNLFAKVDEKNEIIKLRKPI